MVEPRAVPVYTTDPSIQGLMAMMYCREVPISQDFILTSKRSPLVTGCRYTQANSMRIYGLITQTTIHPET